MSKRRRDQDPNDLTAWIGQPYTPHDPHYALLNPSRSRSSLKTYGLTIGLLLGGFAIICLAFLVVGLFQISELASWVLLILFTAGGIGIVAGLVIAWNRRMAKLAQHHHHHKRQ